MQLRRCRLFPGCPRWPCHPPHLRVFHAFHARPCYCRRGQLILKFTSPHQEPRMLLTDDRRMHAQRHQRRMFRTCFQPDGHRETSAARCKHAKTQSQQMIQPKPRTTDTLRPRREEERGANHSLSDCLLQDGFGVGSLGPANFGLLRLSDEGLR